jgi:uncharacterized membrane protein
MGVVAMKRLGEFLKTTLLGGLLVLLPVLLLYLLLAETLPLIIALATPIADLFPKGTFDRINFPVLIALILLVGASFVIGLGLRSAVGRRMGGWIEQNTLGRLAAYSALKGLTKGFVGAKEEAAFRPALLISSEGEQELAYVIEDHGDGNLTVLVPWSPAAFAGSVKIVSQDRIEWVNTNLGEFTNVLGHWGVGVKDLLKRGQKRGQVCS